MNPILIAKLGAAALIFSAGFGACAVWKNGQITQMELTYAIEQLTAELDARDDAERRIAQITAAQNNAQTRLRVVSDDRGRADLVGNGLRISTAEAVRASAENPAACADNAAALGVVFDQCAAAFVGMAETADRWAVEALMQHEAAK